MRQRGIASSARPGVATAAALVLVGSVLACSPGSFPPPAGGAVATPSPVAAEAEPARPGATPALAVGAPATLPPVAPRKLTGMVLDIQQTPVPGAQVQARSVDRDVTFAAEARADAEGRYVFEALPPPGTTLEVGVTAFGGATRRRLVTLGTRDVVLDFGGKTGEGAAFFLADRPEIVMVSPGRDEELKTRDRLRCTLRFSHRLQPESAERFAAALRILPANREAGGLRGGAVDVTTAGRRYPFIRPLAGLAPYTLGAGDGFREDSTSRARLAFSESGLEATLSFDAPLLTGFQRARYQVVLVSDGQPLRDVAGRVLGTGAEGLQDTWPKAGDLILGAFHSQDPDFSSVEGLSGGGSDALWAATHDHASAFWLARDTAPPRLEGLEVRTLQRDTILRLVFDEPLVAYDGSRRGALGEGLGQAALDLAKLTFVAAERGKLTLRPLEKLVETEVVTLDPTQVATFGAANELGVPFRFDAAAFTDSLTAVGTGRVYLGPDARDPSVLQLVIFDRPRFFAEAVREVAVRAEGQGDPAQNVRRAGLAEENIVSAEL